MLTEPRWIPDTKIARKLHGVIDDSKPGYILVQMPLKVSEFDDHMAHIKVHQDDLEACEDNAEIMQELVIHILEHHSALADLAVNKASVTKWVVPKTSNEAEIVEIKPPNPPTNTNTKEEG